MSKGSKKRDAQRRRQRKQQERRRVKKAAVRHRLPGTKRKRKAVDLPGLDDWTDDEHRFWVCHGVNYMASSYDDAIWQPVFPGIYEGKTYSEQAIVRRISDQYRDDLNADEGFNVGKAIVAFAIQGKPEHFGIRLRCLAAVEQDHGDEAEEVIQQPHQDAVWSFFNDLSRVIQQRV